MHNEEADKSFIKLSSVMRPQYPVQTRGSSAGFAFFGLILGGDIFAGTIANLGMTPLYAAVLVGAAQNVFSKSAKYSLFDPCKEMAYIPLDKETQVSTQRTLISVPKHCISQAEGLTPCMKTPSIVHGLALFRNDFFVTKHCETLPWLLSLLVRLRFFFLACRQRERLPLMWCAILWANLEAH